MEEDESNKIMRVPCAPACVCAVGRWRGETKQGGEARPEGSSAMTATKKRRQRVKERRGQGEARAVLMQFFLKRAECVGSKLGDGGVTEENGKVQERRVWCACM
ncbi:hypothetical protein GOP47_0021251, partial [Adiantum capillus-veneris]